MKVYIVNKENCNCDNGYPLKGFKKEEEAIKYMNLCIEEVLRNDNELKLQVVTERNKSIYVENDNFDDGKEYLYIFWISTVEVF